MSQLLHLATFLLQMDRPNKKRKQWSEENMKKAILSVRAKEMELKRTSKFFDVPKSTLKDKVNGQEGDVDKLVTTKLGRKPVLGQDLESELLKYCLIMDSRFFGLTTNDVRNEFSARRKKWNCSFVLKERRKSRLDMV